MIVINNETNDLPFFIYTLYSETKDGIILVKIVYFVTFNDFF